MVEGKVHGGTSVWQSLKMAFPGGRKTGVVSAPQAPSSQEAKRPEAQTRAAVVDRASILERSETSGDGAPGKTFSQFAGSSAAPQPGAALSFGYSRNLESRFRVIREVARGGNGIVTLVQDIHNGTEWAMKSLPKVLSDPNVSDKKREEHAEAIKREVEVLRRLRGCLNVASLEEVYEDDTHVHIVMEYCRGGELHHRIGAAHYSERTVASFMRATLRTLAQCHAAKILHRDVKPGNFLLSSEADNAPLKAVDFGLAVFFDDRSLPRTDLGLEGTPWFMAPETLRSEVLPASDLWAAGVMAHQLLTGRFPFDDRSNPISPSLSKVWKSILTDTIDFKRSHWDGISDEAKDFVKMLLNKDPAQRPSAKDALKHPWLQGRIEERSSGRPLSLKVVGRIQRYSQASVFKRSVLEMIAEELLAEDAAEAQAQAALQAAADYGDITAFEAAGEGSGGAAHAPATPPRAPASCALSEDARPVIDHPSASPLEYLYERLRLADRALIDRAALAEGLNELGYTRLSAEEVDRLLDQLDPGNTGAVAKSQLAASQMDWKALQESQKERWLRCARRAFADLDADRDGVVSVEDMVALLRHKLPAAEVEAAVRQALMEATRRRDGGVGNDGGSQHGGSAGGSVHNGSVHNGSVHGGDKSSHGGSQSDPSLRNGLNFRQFVRMLTVGSADSLDIFDDRLGSSFGSPDKLGSFDKLNTLIDRSVKGGNQLEPVLEMAEYQPSE